MQVKSEPAWQEVRVRGWASGLRAQLRTAFLPTLQPSFLCKGLTGQCPLAIAGDDFLIGMLAGCTKVPADDNAAVWLCAATVPASDSQPMAAMGEDILAMHATAYQFRKPPPFQACTDETCRNDRSSRSWWC